MCYNEFILYRGGIFVLKIKNKAIRFSKSFCSVSVILAIVMLMFAAVPVAYAGDYYDDYNASETIINKKTGTLKNGESAKISFKVASESEVTVYFDNSTEGSYDLSVADSEGYIEYETSDYDSSTHEMELDKGSYTLTLTENGNSDSSYAEGEEEIPDSVLNYSFSITRRYNKIVKTTKVSLDRKKVKICRGNGFYLNAKYSPSNSTQSGSWKSSNKKVAEVSSSGYVTAKNLGKATITYKHGSKKATCKVTVNHETVQMAKGSSVSLKKMVKYIKGYKKAKWTTTSSGKVSVTNKGKMKAKAHGQATITAKIKGTKYKFKVYAYDKKVIKKKTIALVKSKVLHPKSLKVHTTLYPSFNSVKLYMSHKNAYGEKVNFYCTGNYNFGSFYVNIYLGSVILRYYGS